MDWLSLWTFELKKSQVRTLPSCLYLNKEPNLLKPQYTQLQEDAFLWRAVRYTGERYSPQHESSVRNRSGETVTMQKEGCKCNNPPNSLLLQHPSLYPWNQLVTCSCLKNLQDEGSPGQPTPFLALLSAPWALGTFQLSFRE